MIIPAESLEELRAIRDLIAHQQKLLTSLQRDFIGLVRMVAGEEPQGYELDLEKGILQKRSD